MITPHVNEPEPPVDPSELCPLCDNYLRMCLCGFEDCRRCKGEFKEGSLERGVCEECWKEDGDPGFDPWGEPDAWEGGIADNH